MSLEMVSSKLFLVKLTISLLGIAYGFHISHQIIDVKERIVEGEEINASQAPYTVFLIRSWGNATHFFMGSCTAAIISEIWILTAAHCVKHPEKMRVYSGAPKTENSIFPRYPVQRHVVSKVIPHEEYHEFVGQEIPPLNDIALIKLIRPIEFDEFRQSIPIATDSDLPETSQRVLVSGYGTIDSDTIHVSGNPLKFINETVLPQERCQEVYPNDKVSDFFCTEVDDKGGVCHGDSGGPAVIDGKLAGIMSFGYRDYCNTKFGPELYTRVHLYHEWINRKMNESI